MASFRFSRRSLADLDSIAEYTVRTWGEVQAVRYVGQLEQAIKRLVDIPVLGRRCEHVRPGLWRIEQGSHVVFFRRAGDDVVICRILHYRMLPEYQSMDDAED